MTVSTQLLVADYRRAVIVGDKRKAQQLLAEIRKTDPLFEIPIVNRQKVIAENYDLQREVSPLPTIFYPVESGRF